MVAVLQQHGGPQLQQAAFSPGELRAVIRAGDHRDQAAILIGLNCAIGNSDMGRLRWGDLVERKLAGRVEHVYEQVRGKTGRQRRTSLGLVTVKTPERWKEGCRTRDIAVGAQNLVFTARDGTTSTHAGLDGDAQLRLHDASARRFDARINRLGIKSLVLPGTPFVSSRHMGNRLRGGRQPGRRRQPVPSRAGIRDDVEDLQQRGSSCRPEGRRGDLARAERWRRTCARRCAERPSAATQSSVNVACGFENRRQVPGRRRVTSP